MPIVKFQGIKLNEKKHNYFYKITNKINGKYYYGIHSTDNLDDGYLGGGIRITNAVLYYGKENFEKEIISDYPTRKEASDHEKQIVTNELVKLDNCYNLRSGGDNEFKMSDATKQILSEINTGKIIPDETRKKISDTLLAKYQNEPKIGRTQSDEVKKKISLKMKGVSKSDEMKTKLSQSRTGSKNPMYGKTHTKETRDKMSKDKRGNKNSFFGKKHTEEAKLKMKESNKNRINPGNSKSCCIEGVTFKMLKLACNKYNISAQVLRHRLKSSKWKNWKYE